MKFRSIPLSGAYVIKLEPFKDDRGIFCRLFCSREMLEIGFTKEIKQINKSSTPLQGTIRGLHFQHPPMAEVKIVQCIRGSVFDVIVDIRKGSPTFLQWHGEILNYDDFKMVFVPEGFAHGFQILEPNSELLYFNSECYDPKHEDGLRYNDPLIGIKWPIVVSSISEKDGCHPLLSNQFVGISI